MNPRVLTAVSALLTLTVPSQACGPFFPDTVLDKPQAALAVPPVSYLHNLCRLAGMPAPESPLRVVDPAPLPDSPYARQLQQELAELRALWEKEGVSADVIAKRLSLYEQVREKLLAPLPTQEDRTIFPTHAEPPSLPVRPLGNDFPADVADYVEAARLQASSRTADARVIWKAILDRPQTERNLRGAWAAWMLAKTTADKTESRGWYERVQKEIDAGASDAIGLGPAAKLWRAGLILRSAQTTDLIAGVHLAFDVFTEDDPGAYKELRRLTASIRTSNDADLLRAAAADPLVRRLINIDLHAALDGWEGSISAPVSQEEQENPLQPWLTALESIAPAELDDASRVAWALYSSGRFEESKKWLALCPPSDPLALWLEAKFDLRDGKLDEANKHLAEAVRIQSVKPGWDPKNPPYVGYYDGISDGESTHQSRMLADSGIVSLALRDYLAALESLRKGGFEQDAAYLAENIISTDGLIRHVRKVSPQWVPAAKEPWEQEQDDLAAEAPPPPFSEILEHGVRIQRLSPDSELRYLLGRRLARERRFSEAREFMPAELLPYFDHYVKLDKARRSGRYSGKTLAAIAWNQARMHRHLGAEFFGTQGAPDSGALYFSFDGTPFHEIRKLGDGWKHDWSQDPAYIPGIAPEDKAIPEVTTDEVSRLKKNSVRPMMRFHYRYTAADLAWQATRCLPANHPDLAAMYNTAGQWLSNRDPKAADRFYQAMVRRCAKTPEGKSADEKRWFLSDLAPLQDLPYLPASLLPPQTASNP